MEIDDTDSDEPQVSTSPNPNHQTLGDGDGDGDGDDDGFYWLPEKKKRRSEETWSERSTAALLEVWGDSFVRLGSRSLRAEEWRDVAERLGRTEAQCRTGLGSLKSTYRAERDRAEASGLPSAWGFFAKMEAQLSSSAGAGGGLACGVDSGEFVFSDMRACLDRATGLDEMEDSPAESEASGGSDSEEAGIGELAESVGRLREIYGRVERDKRRQMVELEKMRRDCQMDLELQKRHIMETARAEIAEIRSGHDHTTALD